MHVISVVGGFGLYRGFFPTTPATAGGPPTHPPPLPLCNMRSNIVVEVYVVSVVALVIVVVVQERV